MTENPKVLGFDIHFGNVTEKPIGRDDTHQMGEVQISEVPGHLTGYLPFVLALFDTIKLLYKEEGWVMDSSRIEVIDGNATVNLIRKAQRG